MHPLYLTAAVVLLFNLGSPLLKSSALVCLSPHFEVYICIAYCTVYIYVIIEVYVLHSMCVYVANSAEITVKKNEHFVVFRKSKIVECSCVVL